MACSSGLQQSESGRKKESVQVRVGSVGGQCEERRFKKASIFLPDLAQARNPTDLVKFSHTPKGLEQNIGGKGQPVACVLSWKHWHST